MTGLLLKLFGAQVDDAVHIAKASLAFRGGIGMGWFVLLLLGLGGIFAWMHRSSPSSLSVARKTALASLRILFVGLILLLLMRPILSFTVEGSVRRLLVLLVDTSASMQIKDPRLDPDDQKRAALGKGLLDPAKGLAQSLEGGQLKEVEQIGRMDLLKSILKNERLNLLPRLEKEFDLDAFTFGQEANPLAVRKEAEANPGAKPAATAATPSSLTWVE